MDEKKRKQDKNHVQNQKQKEQTCAKPTKKRQQGQTNKENQIKKNIAEVVVLVLALVVEAAIVGGSR